MKNQKLISYYIVRSIGRNPDNPGDRRKGILLQQRLEINSNNICNCLTRVSKDNMVLEIYGNGEDKASN